MTHSRSTGASPASAVPKDARDVSAQTDFVTFHEGYVRHYIALADTKAAVLFGLTGAILAYLFGKQPFYDLVTHATFSCIWILAVACTVTLVLSSICSLLVIVPRRATSGEGLVFFGSVAQFSGSDEYLAAVNNASEEQLTTARIRHSYDVAKVCNRKYRTLIVAIWVGAVGMATALPLIGLLKPAP